MTLLKMPKEKLRKQGKCLLFLLTRTGSESLGITHVFNALARNRPNTVTVTSATLDPANIGAITSPCKPGAHRKLDNSFKCPDADWNLLFFFFSLCERVYEREE